MDVVACICNPYTHIGRPKVGADAFQKAESGPHFLAYAVENKETLPKPKRVGRTDFHGLTSSHVPYPLCTCTHRNTDMCQTPTHVPYTAHKMF